MSLCPISTHCPLPNFLKRTGQKKHTISFINVTILPFKKTNNNPAQLRTLLDVFQRSVLEPEDLCLQRTPLGRQWDPPPQVPGATLQKAQLSEWQPEVCFEFSEGGPSPAWCQMSSSKYNWEDRHVLDAVHVTASLGGSGQTFTEKERVTGSLADPQQSTLWDN